MAIVEYQVTDTPLWRRWIGKNSSYDSGWKSAESDTGSVDNYTYYWFRMARTVSSSGSIPMAVKSLHWRANCKKNEYREVTFTFYDGDPFNGGLPYKTVTQGLDGTGTLIVDADIEREFLTGEFYCRLSWEYGFESTPIPQVTAELHLQTPDVTLVSPLDTSADGADYVYFRYQTDYHGLSPAAGLRAGIQWRTEDGEWSSITSSQTPSSENSVTASIGIFPEGKIIWRTRGQAQYAGAGDYAEGEFTVAYEHPAITIVKPIDGVDGNSKIKFEWQSYTSSAKAGSRVEIDYSYDQIAWENLISTGAEEDNHTHTFEANPKTFNPGIVYYRIREKYRNSNYGEYAYGSFTALESFPRVFNVSPNGKFQDKTNPITITWTSEIDYGAIAGSELEYDLSDGQGWRSLGTVTGSDKSYTVPANTFPAVAYTDAQHKTGGIRIRVRSKNRNDIFSAWTEASFATVDVAVTAYPQSPKNNAQVDETKEKEFSFSAYSNALQSYPTAFDIRWRVQNGQWSNTVYVNSDEITYFTGKHVFEANTFPAAVIEWQVRAYNNDSIAGDWSYSGYFTTIDQPQISTALTPSGTIEDADEPITFTWSTRSTSGEASRGADLQYSQDNATWINLGPSVESGPQIPGNVHEYEAPGHTIPPGSIFWRVRSYNRNMVAGDWSAAVSFVAKAAPTVQDIQATAEPWATVIWQADDQQTYEIFVDGESLGSYFGTEKQFPLPDYLEDGVHTVGVRVMGSFSLWSQINETQITIANTQAASLTLTAETAVDTALTWEGGTGDFFIYRDGLMIAHTNAHSFTDRVTLGTHEYQVIERLASGDYNASGTVTQTPSVPYQHIAALAGGDWIGIPYTLKSQSEPSYQESQEVAYNYLSSNDYPTASIGSHRTDVGQYSAVFLYTEETSNRAFLALRGKPVILKTADGEVMIGVLNAWERRPKSTQEKRLYTAYTFSLQRIGWEDFIDDTA